MGKEETYEALDYIIGEVTEIFKTTPFFHIGGDEAYLEKVIDDPDVKKYNKQMCAWEQAEKTEIPSLRKRLPALNERIWNLKGNMPYEEFMRQLEIKDKQLSLLIDDDRQDDLLIGHNFSEDDGKK